MSEPSGLQTENYQEDIDRLNSEISELDNLYKSSKAILENVTNSRARGSLAFTHLQTGNLISIKNAKIAALKNIVSLKEKRFKQNQAAALIAAASESDLSVGSLLQILAANNVKYTPSKFNNNELEEVEFEEAVEKELESQGVKEEPKEEFKGETYVPPEPKVDVDKALEGIENLEELPFKTDDYELVADIATGKIVAIDLRESTEKNTVKFELDLLGIDEDERAVIDMSNGIPKATFRGRPIEAVNIEE